MLASFDSAALPCSKTQSVAEASPRSLAHRVDGCVQRAIERLHLAWRLHQATWQQQLGGGGAGLAVGLAVLVLVHLARHRGQAGRRL